MQLYKLQKLLLRSEEPGAVKCIADSTCQYSGRSHLTDCIDAHKRADEQENVLPSDQTLYILCITIQDNECSHEKDRVQKGRKEACDKAAYTGSARLLHEAENIAKQKTVQYTGNKPLNKGQDGIDIKQNSSHGT